MDSLSAALQRLFGRPGQPLPDPWPESGALLEPVDPDGRAWALVIGLPRPAGGAMVRALCEGATALDLPVPAVSLAGDAGFHVWFALTDPVPAERGRVFLEALCRRCLPEGASRALRLPGTAGLTGLSLPPARDGGRWTAFIDPSLAGMFDGETWLDMAPSPERQAELLAGFRAIRPAEFDRALAELDPPGAVVPSPRGVLAGQVVEPPALSGTVPPLGLGVGSGFVDPRTFLLAVMNDPGASADHRIDAAKALLPYFER